MILIFIQNPNAFVVAGNEEEYQNSATNSAVSKEEENAAIISAYKLQHFPTPTKQKSSSYERSDVENAASMPLPPLDMFKEAMLDKKIFITFVDKIVEQIAYWIIQHQDIRSKEGHTVYRKRLQNEYNLLKDTCLKVNLWTVKNRVKTFCFKIAVQFVKNGVAKPFAGIISIQSPFLYFFFKKFSNVRILFIENLPG